MRILSAQHVAEAITMREAIDAVREGYIALSAKRATVPLRGKLQTPDGVTLLMPSYLHGTTSTVTKIVSVYPKNARFGLPTIMATVLVLDAETGQPRALLDGSYLTALRTGAASGLATDLLARKDASVLGVIGAGTQARTQIQAVCTVRPIREIRVFALNGTAEFVESLIPRYPNITIKTAQSPEQALQGADLMVAATTSGEPVIRDEHVAPGAHINGIGSYQPHTREIAGEVVARARIVIDSREACLEEAGDLLIPIEQGLIDMERAMGTEIGEVAAGLKPGRTSDDEITFFKSVGVAVQDAAVAARVVATAEERNLGTVVAL
jgi:ornithine cyclodeaminase